MATKGIVLGHKISAARLEVDQAKVSMIETLLPPNTVKGIRSFLGHAGFYRRFIKDFSKISRPLCKLLEKDAKFEFDDSCLSAFKEIKSRLVIAPIMATPDWNKEIEIMCDASDYVSSTPFSVRPDWRVRTGSEMLRFHYITLSKSFIKNTRKRYISIGIKSFLNMPKRF